MITSRCNVKPAKISRLLIANRGEIACRIIRTLKKLSITSIAVYSEADANGLHVQMADEAYLIGEAPAKDSYLNIDKLIEVALMHRVDAIHPGFGFLSENADFAAAVAKAGIIFIGPNPDAIRIMGDKIQAKKLAEQAGVPVLPMLHSDADAVSKLDPLQLQQQIGLPMIIKAAAGGGGKGIRVVENLNDIPGAIQSVRNEAKAAFGDDRIFIERYLQQPRHIEIQILADQHGNCIYLGNRECSIQRRHQKIIEESPSPALTQEQARQLGEACINLAKSVNYCSVGTIELMLDRSGNCHFLEMNTRLQVEHPVTEMLFAIDLVEWMIRVAKGEQLTMQQADLVASGHAIEARIYAEDPLNDSLPATGMIRHCALPQTNGLRFDSGITLGSKITAWYDPMLAKIIAHDKDRKRAIRKLTEGLGHLSLRGIRNNVIYLQSILRNSKFQSGEFHTEFLAEIYPNGFSDQLLLPADYRAMVLVAANLELAYRKRRWNDTQIELAIEQLLVSIFNYGAAQTQLTTDNEFIVNVNDDTVSVNGTVGKLLSIDGFNCRLDIGNQQQQFSYKRHGIFWRIVDSEGCALACRVLTTREGELGKRLKQLPQKKITNAIVSPMPALVTKILVTAGDKIKAGQTLVILEAMKMENQITALADAEVAAVNVKVGDQIQTNDQLILFQQIAAADNQPLTK